MALLSIKEDFLQRTLGSVPGILGKLTYISELREDNRYVHWGLAQIYGEEATQRALREVHRALVLQVLRTPLRQLVEDVVPSAAGKCVDPKQFAESLARNSASLLPPGIGGVSLAHFHSTIEALSLLFAQAKFDGEARGATSSGM